MTDERTPRPKRTPRSRTAKTIEQCEKALAKSKANHREAFRRALADIFAQYGLTLSPVGPNAKLAITKFDPAKPAELPE